MKRRGMETDSNGLYWCYFPVAILQKTTDRKNYKYSGFSGYVFYFIKINSGENILQFDFATDRLQLSSAIHAFESLDLPLPDWR